MFHVKQREPGDQDFIRESKGPLEEQDREHRSNGSRSGLFHVKQRKKKKSRYRTSS